MSLTVTTARMLTQAADYLIPCPAASWLDLPGVADVLLSPAIHRGGISGVLIFSKCNSACAVCEAFVGRVRAIPQQADGFSRKLPEEERAALYRATARQVAGEWREHLIRVAIAQPRCATILSRMERRGLLPEGFAARLPSSATEDTTP